MQVVMNSLSRCSARTRATVIRWLQPEPGKKKERQLVRRSAQCVGSAQSQPLKVMRGAK